METIQGKRVYLNELDDLLLLKQGEYGFNPKDGIWYARVPNGHIGNLANHQVTEHEDGTITVSPSILVSGYDEEKGEKTIWHGYLVRGVWQPV